MAISAIGPEIDRPLCFEAPLPASFRPSLRLLRDFARRTRQSDARIGGRHLQVYRLSAQIQSAVSDARLAHEDRLQSRATPLPSLGLSSQYLNTQGNGLIQRAEGDNQ
jgi:hypothetical protein